MFAIVRTGGKQYRVAAGDKIVVEKLAGEAGDTVTLDDVLLAGDGGELRSTDGLTVAAEIVAQAKGDKVTVFKKRRRHNYRRKKGHRQQHTILRIVAIGDQKADSGKKPKAEAKAPAAAPAAAAEEPATTPAATADPDVKGQIEAAPTESPAPEDEAQANPPKAAKPKKAAAEKPAKPASTKNAAPAKGAAEKSKPKTPKAK